MYRWMINGFGQSRSPLKEGIWYQDRVQGMIFLSGLGRSILLLFLAVVVSSCATIGGRQAPGNCYTMPPVTYIRELPGYASEIVVTVYRGEQVKILSNIKGEEWCRVQTVAGGETGWIQRPLLSPVPIPIETYYVQAPEVPLRPEPHQEIISRLALHRGEEVRKLAENEQGWWRVLVERDKSIGWLPAATLASSPPPPTSAGVTDQPSQAGALEVSSSRPLPKPYFVAAAALELHLLPLVSSPVVKVLQLNDRVEKVYQSGPKWLKVKFPETGVQGWTQASYLSESPVKTPQPVSVKKKKAPPKTKRPKIKGKPAGQPPDLEPEIM